MVSGPAGHSSLMRFICSSLCSPLKTLLWLSRDCSMKRGPDNETSSAFDLLGDLGKSLVDTQLFPFPAYLLRLSAVWHREVSCYGPV